MHATTTFDGFISECLQILDSTTTGMAIYILSCLCPEDSNVILELVHLDLSQPHHHEHLPEKCVHVASRSYADTIAYLRAYADALPTKVYRRLWLEVAQRWLLTCRIAPDYYPENDTGKDSFCQRMHNELIERILKID